MCMVCRGQASYSLSRRTSPTAAPSCWTWPCDCWCSCWCSGRAASPMRRRPPQVLHCLEKWPGSVMSWCFKTHACRNWKKQNMHVCMHVCTCTCTHTYTHACMHTHTHTHTHKHTCIHACTHTYIHTHCTGGSHVSSLFINEEQRKDGSWCHVHFCQTCFCLAHDVTDADYQWKNGSTHVRVYFIFEMFDF